MTYNMDYDIFFDQFSRYKLCSDILNKISDIDDTVLDVGSGDSCILEKFLPKHNITFVDPILAIQTGRPKNKLAVNIFSKELDSKHFDFVVCIDTLDNISQEQRENFVTRLISLSTKGVILASPCKDEGNPIAVDQKINSVFNRIFQNDCKWISNHIKNDLPLKSKIIKDFSNHGFHIHTFQNGYCLWLENLLPYMLCMLNLDQDNHLVKNISKNFNKNLYQYDHQTPCYRQFIVGTKEKIPKPEVQIQINSENLNESNKMWIELQNELLLDVFQFLSKLTLDKKSLENKIINAINDVDLLQKINLQNIADQEKLKHLSKLESKLESKERELSKLESKLESKERELKNLNKSIVIDQNLITEIHQSFVFRMLHKYDQTIGKILPLRPKKFLKSNKTFQSQDEFKKLLLKIPVKNLTKKDIICLPIINWDYRFQRPQHFMSKFADMGHRVFYFTVNLLEIKHDYEIKEIQKNIYEIKINSPKFFDIYKDSFQDQDIDIILDHFDKFKNDLNLDAITLVQFPTWRKLALELRNRYNFKIIFDCLDDFVGFGNVVDSRIKEEEKLAAESDLVLATSSFLFQKIAKFSKNSLLLPNACEFDHFAKNPNSQILSEYNKPIIGYFGSIADWFDNDLLEYVTNTCTDYTFVFIGHTFGSDIRKLQKLKNVHFFGERPYSELPKYLHNFDVCLIPFKKTPLIHATHPIKIYEYMAAGKPVVTTDMPELYPMSKICYVSKTKEDFLANIKKAVQENDPDLHRQRIEFASKNTWQGRFDNLYEKLESFGMNHHN